MERRPSLPSISARREEAAPESLGGAGSGAAASALPQLPPSPTPRRPPLVAPRDRGNDYGPGETPSTVNLAVTPPRRAVSGDAQPVGGGVPPRGLLARQRPGALEHVGRAPRDAHSVPASPVSLGRDSPLRALARRDPDRESQHLSQPPSPALPPPSPQPGSAGFARRRSNALLLRAHSLQLLPESPSPVRPSRSGSSAVRLSRLPRPPTPAEVAVGAAAAAAAAASTQSTPPRPPTAQAPRLESPLLGSSRGVGGSQAPPAVESAAGTTTTKYPDSPAAFSSASSASVASSSSSTSAPSLSPSRSSAAPRRADDGPTMEEWREIVTLYRRAAWSPHFCDASLVPSHSLAHSYYSSSAMAERSSPRGADARKDSTSSSSNTSSPLSARGGGATQTQGLAQSLVLSERSWQAFFGHALPAAPAGTRPAASALSTTAPAPAPGLARPGAPAAMDLTLLPEERGYLTRPQELDV